LRVQRRGRDVEGGDARAARPRNRDRHLRGAARRLGAGDRNEDVDRTAEWILLVGAARDRDGERALELAGDAARLVVEAVVRDHVRNADHHQVIALAGLLGDRLLRRALRCPRGNVDRTRLLRIGPLGGLGGALDRLGVFVALLLAGGRSLGGGT